MTRTPTLDQLRDFLLGERLGFGVDREVYVYRPDPRLVIKLQVGEYDFQNVAEWNLWVNASAALRKHLAPVHDISPTGAVLLQARCEPCPEHLIPAKMPKVLADLHKDNLGLYEGRPVAVDYGRHLAYAMSANAKAMSKVRG